VGEAFGLRPEDVKIRRMPPHEKIGPQLTPRF
jgi:hypothetical protein